MLVLYEPIKNYQLRLRFYNEIINQSVLSH